MVKSREKFQAADSREVQNWRGIGDNDQSWSGLVDSLEVFAELLDSIVDRNLAFR